MSSYVSRRGRLTGTTLWRVTADDNDCAQFRVLPDAAMDVVFSAGKLVFAGPDTSACFVPSSPGAVTWGLRFAPGLAYELLGVPADELVNQRIDLCELVPLRASLLEAVWHEPAEALEQIAIELWQRARPDTTVLSLARSIDRSARAGATVGEMVELHDIPERSLRRLSCRMFGYGPKTLMTIHRFQQALRYARAGFCLGEIAALARYADQSHLSREAQRLTGATFRTLTTAH